MPAVTSTHEPQEPTLNRAATDALLREAVARRAPIGLLIACNGLQRRVAGELLGVDGGHLEIRIESGGASLGTLAEMSAIQARFELDGTRYVFDTHWTGRSPVDVDGAFRIEAPIQIASSDRRRSVRRRLRRRTGVTLHVLDRRPQRTVEGVLLNLSADGLACRVPRHELAGLRAGRTVRAVFQPDGRSAAYELSARVAGVTAAGTRHQFVVGVEFIDDDHYRDCREHLCAVLGAHAKRP